ncbi:MAG: FecR family protein, partial [Alphaproteobacteria bacterium]
MVRARPTSTFDRFAGALVAVAITILSSQPAAAVERIGNAIQIVRTVTGEVQADFRYLILEDPVFQDEVIATRPGSASRIVFRDRSELQVGPEARVTLDSFVFDTEPSAARFVISVFDGVLRFATGKLAKSAYRIETPTAIIGVRGTTFASIFGPDGEQVILLEEGIAITVQNRIGGPLRTLTQPGLSITVLRDGAISNPQPPPQWAVDKLRELTALLFTLDKIQRGDQFDDDDEVPVEPPPPVQQEAAVQPPPPPAPAAKPEYRPHKPHYKAKPQPKPTHRGLDRAYVVSSTTAKDHGLALALVRADVHAAGTTAHGNYRSDIRIERQKRTTSVHIERDENHAHVSNQLIARTQTRGATRHDTRERDRPEHRTAHDNRQGRASPNPPTSNERHVSAAKERPQHVSVNFTERRSGHTRNRNDR